MKKETPKFNPVPLYGQMKKETPKFNPVPLYGPSPFTARPPLRPAMLGSAGCKYVIIGHSERRQYFGDNDDTVNKKIRAALEFGLIPDLSMNLVYDVCHNIAKKEYHIVDGEKRAVCVHRKGATRSFPAGHEGLCEKYRKVGQPILIPGDMGTASYVLVGTKKAMEETFGSTCHGAGRVLSRRAAKRAGKGRAINRELEDKGILVRWTGRSTLAEEMPEAYKDISQVIDVVHGAGISKKVAKLRPMAVLKG